MPKYIADQPRRASDANGVLTLLGCTLAAVLCMFAVGYFLTRHWSQEQEVRVQQQQQFEIYQRNTAPALPAPLPADAAESQQVRARLLAHPGVTPGPGFDKPGVQSTGMAIVDAIEQAQTQSAAKTR